MRGEGFKRREKGGQREEKEVKGDRASLQIDIDSVAHMKRERQSVVTTGSFLIFTQLANHGVDAGFEEKRK